LTSLDRETVRRVAEHARLSLTSEELDRFSGQLGVVLGAFAELDAVDVEGVEPSYQPVPLEDVVRGDEPTRWDWDPFANSRRVEGRHLRGPRIT